MPITAPREPIYRRALSLPVSVCTRKMVIQSTTAERKWVSDIEVADSWIHLDRKSLLQFTFYSRYVLFLISKMFVISGHPTYERLLQSPSKVITSKYCLGSVSNVCEEKRK